MDFSGSSMAPNDRRRHRKNKKKAAGALPPLTGPAIIHDVPLDLLKLILLRLDSSLWLIRAASVCKLWRGVIAGGDGDFLRLSRGLHPPSIASYYRLDRDPMAFVPSSPPATGRVGRFISLDFLPAGKMRWKVADSHGGLVLLLESNRCYPDIIMCDPLTRRHQGIIHPRGISAAGTYLLDRDADAGGGAAVSMSNFRVFYKFYDNRQPRACVFSTAEDGDWHLMNTMLLQERQTYYRTTCCPYTLPWPPLLQACVGQSRRRQRR